MIRGRGLTVCYFFTPDFASSPEGSGRIQGVKRSPSRCHSASNRRTPVFDNAVNTLKRYIFVAAGKTEDTRDRRSPAGRCSTGNQDQRHMPPWIQIISATPREECSGKRAADERRYSSEPERAKTSWNAPHSLTTEKGIRHGARFRVFHAASNDGARGDESVAPHRCTAYPPE